MRKEKTFRVPDTQMVTHQGDVVIERLTEMPKGLKEIEQRPFALGEFSGHRHVAVADRETLQFFEDEQGRVYIQPNKDWKVRHSLENGVWTGEHHAMVLAPAPYRISIQRVEDPYTETLDNVRD